MSIRLSHTIPLSIGSAGRQGQEMIAYHVLSRHNFNAVAGILAITVLSILVVWVPVVLLRMPMPEGVIASMAVTTAMEVSAGVLLPYFWAMKRLGLSFRDLGITKCNLWQSIYLGCALYTIALLVFFHCTSGEMMANHTIRKASLEETLLLVPMMGLIAAGTDMSTRGFILLSLSRYSHVAFAVLMQNVVWFLGHLHEIELLTDCLGFKQAVGLTILLGVLGDVIVLRTRNVIGLAVAHFLLNIILSVYLRHV